MFDALFNVSSWGHLHWVAFAWAQLFITYSGYQLYLRRRLKHLEERSSND